MNVFCICRLFIDYVHVFDHERSAYVQVAT